MMGNESRRLFAPLSLVRGILFTALLAGWAQPAWAHKPSDAFITLDIEGTALSGQLDMALKDLEVVFHFDRKGDGKITWGEVRERQADLFAYATTHLKLTSDSGPCALNPLDLQISTYTDGAYASVIFDTACVDRPIRTLDATYDALFDVDAQHRGLVKLTYREEQFTGVLTPQSKTFHFDADAGGGRRIVPFVKEGMHHIYRGFDHMLFLVALVVAGVFVREGRRLIPQSRLSKVLWTTGKVVTSFTVGHSISLALTTFHLMPAPPARTVEALVALTILLTALNNLFPVLKERVWIAGFGFGMIHGIGYASVLGDLGLTGWSLTGPLFGFNVGVELAQLTILAAFLPFAFLLRSTRFYRGVILWGGSLATAGLAAAWMAENVLRVSILRF